MGDDGVVDGRWLGKGREVITIRNDPPGYSAEGLANGLDVYRVSLLVVVALNYSWSLYTAQHKP